MEHSDLWLWQEFWECAGQYKTSLCQSLFQTEKKKLRKEILKAYDWNIYINTCIFHYGLIQSCSLVRDPNNSWQTIKQLAKNHLSWKIRSQNSKSRKTSHAFDSFFLFILCWKKLHDQRNLAASLKSRLKAARLFALESDTGESRVANSTDILGIQKCNRQSARRTNKGMGLHPPLPQNPSVVSQRNVREDGLEKYSSIKHSSIRLLS